MDDVVIRPANPEDIATLAAVEQSAASIFPPGTIPDALRSDSVPVSLLAEALAKGFLWVAAHGRGGTVGFALLREEEGLALLAEMDVSPEHGRKGLGQNLVAAVADKAREMGHAALYLTTFSHVPWNMPFYARLGFTVLDAKGMPPVMEGILAAERERGMQNRVAMRLELRETMVPRESWAR